jgi:uncharacterized protein YgiM (DUF1202 family)
MNQHHKTAIVLSLFLFCAALGVSACASLAASAQPQGGLEAQVNTAVAATLVQHIIETKVAAQSTGMGFEAAPAVQATQAPAPTSTPVPTLPPPTAVPPTAVPPTPVPPTAPPPPPATLSSAPKIVADENTNCRVGPSTSYAVVASFMKGTESWVYGMDQGKNWWYIVQPNNSSAYCWVWEGSTTVYGDTSTVAVVAAPAGTYPTTGDVYYNYNYGYATYNNCYPYGCNDYYYNDCGYNPYHYYGSCYPYYWGACTKYNYNYCTCKPNCKNPCKKNNCPPLTTVNYKKYCQNYPACCK